MFKIVKGVFLFGIDVCLLGMVYVLLLKCFVNQGLFVKVDDKVV